MPGAVSIFPSSCIVLTGFRDGVSGKDLSARAGDVKDMGLISGYGRSS